MLMLYRLYLFLGMSLSVQAINFTAPVANDGPIVDLGYAQYQGYYDGTGNITAFLRIRYATAPTGDLRWRSPQSPHKVPGVQPANKHPVQCLQAAPPGPPSNVPAQPDTGVASEDCLFLDVYVSGAILPSQKLPVIVWIHGGGHVAGSAAMYDGSNIALGLNHVPVVVVVVQYRLGIFGFLAGEMVKRDGALNAGILDQEFALEWVQSHISKFSGDPTKVTIWGESSGAGSVIQHIIAHSGKTDPQLFRGAITSSSYIPPQFKYNDILPETVFRQVVNYTNCTSASDTLSCLRSVDVSSLQLANVNINQGTLSFASSPVIDGIIITDRPTVLLKNGQLNGKRLLVVTNTHEGTIFVNQSGTNVNVSQFVVNLFSGLGRRESSTIASLYESLGTPPDQVSAVLGESLFICPGYLLLQAFRNKSYKGEFAIPPALHGQDLFYYFPNIVLQTPSTPSIYPPPFNNSQFTTTFLHSFLHFAESLDPNADNESDNIAPAWNTYDRGHVEMLFNKTDAGLPDIRAVASDAAVLNRCRYWQSIAPLTGQ